MTGRRTHGVNVFAEFLIVVEILDQTLPISVVSNFRKLIRDGFNNQHMMPWSPELLEDIGGKPWGPLRPCSFSSSTA